MKKIILAKYGELVLKGQNRRTFEDKLMSNIRASLKGVGEYRLSWAQSTVYVEPKSDDFDIDEAFARVRRVFGLSAVCIATKVDNLVGRDDLGTPPVGAVIGRPQDNQDNTGRPMTAPTHNEILAQIGKTAVECVREMLMRHRTFKVETKREDKSFPLNSMQVSAEIGGIVLDAIPELTVDLHNPDIVVTVEIRREIYVHTNRQPGAGGMPIGTNGKATLLLSGGIDSPVAGYMIAKRGVVINAVHFYSYPYTSERAKDKVIALAKLMSGYCGRINLHVVPFTDIQLAINKHCPSELLTLIMRRIMMRISERIAQITGAQALITGESIGQVASQTMESLVVTDAAVEMPVFRPVIGMDKEEIVQISKRIGTYETSILPYEDCCTVFVPKKPKTKPKLEQLVEAEAVLESVDIEDMIAKAVEGTEIVRVGE